MAKEITETEYLLKENLIKLRTDAHLSKYALVQKTGLDYSYYHHLEDMSLPIRPSFKTLELLASFYNKKVYELFIPSGELSSPEKES